ncbi:MAG: 30S ribosomal protein S11 [Candidatus Pacearchaeota archaeon]
MTKEKEERSAFVRIYSSPNNTIVHVTDLAGNTLARVSGGMITKHDRLKSDPTIAMFIAKRIKEMIKDFEIKKLYVRIRGKTNTPGPGPAANAVIKTLSKEGFKIVSIVDVTRIPRGGPKKKGGRRGRRV